MSLYPLAACIASPSTLLNSAKTVENALAVTGCKHRITPSNSVKNIRPLKEPPKILPATHLYSDIWEQHSSYVNVADSLNWYRCNNGLTCVSEEHLSPVQLSKWQQQTKTAKVPTYPYFSSKVRKLVDKAGIPLSEKYSRRKLFASTQEAALTEIYRVSVKNTSEYYMLEIDKHMETFARYKNNNRNVKRVLKDENYHRDTFILIQIFNIFNKLIGTEKTLALFCSDSIIDYKLSTKTIAPFVMRAEPIPAKLLTKYTSKAYVDADEDGFYAPLFFLSLGKEFVKFLPKKLEKIFYKRTANTGLSIYVRDVGSQRNILDKETNRVLYHVNISTLNKTYALPTVKATSHAVLPNF
jgi:hypothetical protein